jgi:ATP-dependent DNA helicase RecQ
MLGGDAVFRDGQFEAVEAVVGTRRRVLVVQRTGWGKSLIYLLATSLLRDDGAGPTLLISPLLSLMRDQIRMAGAIGVRAGTINSGNAGEWTGIAEALKRDEVDILLVSPERIGNEKFLTETLPLVERGIGLFVVDEAHCISDWGHDFRPDYRRIRRIVDRLPRSVPVLATTATANNRVVADIEDQLGSELEVIRGPLARASLRLQVIPLRDQAERLAWLAGNLNRLTGSGIVYCLTQADCERVAAWLGRKGFTVAAYHAGLDGEQREELEEQLRTNEVKALAATVALGMGFDKPDLGFVVHFQRPGSPVAYYQQIGRAGRALPDAQVVLLTGAEDDEIQEYFIRSAFPPAQQLIDVLHALDEAEDGLSVSALEAAVNLPRNRLTQCLKVLEIEGAVVRDRSTYIRTPNEWLPDTQRTELVTVQRRTELARMQELVACKTCLMEFVARELDDPDAARCGRCAVCAGPFLPSEPDPDLLLEANRYLRRAYRPIEPRKQGVGGIEGWTGMIPARRRFEVGRALSFYGDAGWGREVARGKYEDSRFSDELVEAVARMVEDDLRPSPAPTWLTHVPSLRTSLVDDFAGRLALRLRLPHARALRKVRDNLPQKRMANSAQQARNAIGAFEAIPDRVAPGPVLLVDDMVDSRWTFTVCAAVLRDAGSGPVFPVALADSSHWEGRP